jgi:tRNA A37 methylthiotransferase MiaB
MPIRKQRTHILRDLAAQKNLEFRRSMIGKKVSVVTLDGGKALTENFLKVALATPRPANQIRQVQIGGVTPDGLHESGFLPMLHQSGVRL